MPEPPNVLLITTDQMRADHMGCSGNPVVRTPNLDRLAAGGVLLERAYVSNPVCMPNRSTLATGRLPRNHGCWSNGINLPAHERTLADVLAERGYHTALLGKAHFNTFGRGEGVAPEDAGMESRDAWNAGAVTPEWTGPYYGFQHVELCIGHGVDNMRLGHLGQWVREHHPRAAAGVDRRTPAANGASQCYTAAVPTEAHSSSWLGTIGSAYLRRLAADARPFFLWVSFPDPHHPFCPPAPYDGMYAREEVVPPAFGPEALADRPPYFRRAREGGEWWEGIGPKDLLSEMTEPQLREIIARTYGMVTLIDENIGRLLDALDATGLAERTVVVFTSDHGDLMGDCGMLFKGPFLLEGLIRVPMIWRLPAARGAGGGARSAALMSSCDIAPTVLELVGMDVPRAMDGAGQAGVLLKALGDSSGAEAGGRAPAGRDAAFVEFKSMYHTELNLRTIVTADRKLTYYPGLPYGELYDMTAAAPEARNLHDDPAYAADLAALRRRLLDEAVLGHDERLWPTCHA